MTTYKEKSERTDADERALIPAIRRRAFIAKHGVTGGTLESRTETGKAQHSDNPTSRKIREAFKLGKFEERQSLGQQLVESNYKIEQLNERLATTRNHAEKLAERMKELLASELRNSDAADTPAWNRWVNARVEANEALAAYDKAKGDQ